MISERTNNGKKRINIGLSILPTLGIILIIAGVILFFFYGGMSGKVSIIIGMFIIGLMLVFIGIDAIIKAKRIQELIKMGHIVHADFLEVESYLIVCEWKNEDTGGVHTFKSFTVGYDPTDIIKAKGIKTFPVYIDPKNLKRYYVSTEELAKDVASPTSSSSSIQPVLSAEKSLSAGNGSTDTDAPPQSGDSSKSAAPVPAVKAADVTTNRASVPTKSGGKSGWLKTVLFAALFATVGVLIVVFGLGLGNTGKCNGVKFNLKTQFCFDGAVFDKCGGGEYNPTQNVCVDGILNNKCGNDNYNPNSKFCEDGKIYDWYSCDGKKYDDRVEFCRNGEVTRRCNGLEYNTEEQFCLNGVLYGKCGGAQYDPAREYCYKNEVFPLCNGKKYDTKKQFCAYDSVYSKCGGKDYYPDREFCHNGKIVELCGYIPEGDSGEAGHPGVVYNPDTEFCGCARDCFIACSPTEMGPISKCGGKTYNAETHFCENDEIKLRSYDECNDAYDVNEP